jgi:hypothetical protein
MTSTGMAEQARTIALELVGLHRDGAISGADDPEARFYAVLIHLFEARYAGKVSMEAQAPDPAVENKWVGPAYRKPLPVVK